MGVARWRWTLNVSSIGDYQNVATFQRRSVHGVREVDNTVSVRLKETREWRISAIDPVGVAVPAIDAEPRSFTELVRGTGYWILKRCVGHLLGEGDWSRQSRHEPHRG